MPIADETTRNKARALIDELGLPRAADALGTSRDALGRLVGGLDVRAGTIAVVKAALVEAEMRGIA